MMRHKVFWLVFYAIVAWFLMSVLVYFISPLMIFIPPRPATYQRLPGMFHLKTANGKSIAAVYLQNKKAKYTVLYSHGNASDLGMSFHFLKALEQHGFSVIGYDYQGYGASSGKASEKNTYIDIRTVYQYLRREKKIPADRIILMAHSLGTGVATQLATEQPVAGLILESPYLSIYRVYTQIPFLLFDKYNNFAKIKNVHVPLLVIHGKSDSIVPFWQGKALFEAANKPKLFLPISGAGHINFIALDRTQYWHTLQRFVVTLKH